MLKFPTLLSISFFLCLIFTAFTCDKQADNYSKSEISTDNPVNIEVEEVIYFSPTKSKFIPSKYNLYVDDWCEIERLDKEGLPKSALEKVEQVYKKAVKEDNYPQIIKSIIHKSNYIAQLEEEGMVRNMELWQAEIKIAKQPTKQLLQSALAQIVDKYTMKNYSRHRNRTELENSENPDIKTWSSEKLTRYSSELYLASLSNPKLLKTESFHDFRDITSLGNTEAVRQTLYDFLAYRAIDYFMHEKNHLTQPAYKFELRDTAFFAPTEEFLKTKIETRDINSYKRKTIDLFKDLLRHKLDILDCNGLADLELKRLKFVNTNSVLKDKKELYLAALEKLYDYHKGDGTAAEILFEMANWYQQKGNLYKIDSPTYGEEEYKNAFKTAIAYAEKSTEKYPNTFGASLSKQLIHTLKAKSLSLESETVTSSNQAILTKITYRNTKKIYVKLIKWSEEKDAQMYIETKGVLDFDSIEMAFANYLNSFESMQKSTYDLKGTEDFRSHSTEIYFEGLPYGQYLIIMGTDENFAFKNNQLSYTKIIVSDLGYWAQNAQDDSGENKFFTAYNRKTGAPLSGVKVEFYEANIPLGSPFRKNNKPEIKANQEYTKEDFIRRKIGETQSDKNGFFYSNITEFQYYENNVSFCLKLTKGKDVLFLYDGYTNPKFSPKNTHRVAKFFTDRAIYRPGQTVFFKGLLFNYDEYNVPTVEINKSVTVYFRDANRQEIANVKLISNEYGTFNGSFTVPEGGLLGQMNISLTRKDKKQYGGKTIRVEEYKRPKFSIDFEPIEKSYSINDTVLVEGNALAYAGNFVDGAKVSYRVTRSKWAYRRWWYIYQSYANRPGAKMESGETITDKNGKFSISFKAIPDETAVRRNIFLYTVTATVTDITGETHSHTTVVRVGKLSLLVKTDLPTQIEASDLKKVTLETKNLNNEYEAAKGSFELQLLEKPETTFIKRHWAASEYKSIPKEKFNQLFPYLPYDDEVDKKNWAVKKIVFSSEFDTEKSSEIELSKTDFPTGEYKAILKTKDKNGQEIIVEKYLTIVNLNSNTIPVNELAWHYTKNRTYEPGETAKLYFGTNDKNLNVLFSVVRRKKVVLRKWLKVRDLKEELLKIEEEDRGNLFYFFNYAKHNRSFNSRYSQGMVTVPWSNKDLQIEYTSFRDKLLPGQEEEWTLKLKGSKGEKVAAEMLATMYDASLDALSENRFAESFHFSNSYSSFGMRGCGNNKKNSKSIEYLWKQKEEINDNIKQYHKLNLFGFGFYEKWDFRKNQLSDRAYHEYHHSSRLNPYSNRSHQNTISSRFSFINGLNPSTAHRNNLTFWLSGNNGTRTWTATDSATNYSLSASKTKADVTPTTNNGTPQIRENLKETVFFYPNLMTDKEGNISFKFKMNEALTRWKFLGLATTKDLKYAFTEKEIITQKDLMVMPNAPRFFREGDKIEFTAKVVNLTKKELTGKANLKLTNPINGKAVFAGVNFEKDFTVKAGQSARLAWYLDVPDVSKVPVIQHTVSAKAGNFSDAERSITPVLTNRMLVTETMPMPTAGGASKSFIFKSMLEKSSSKTLTQEGFTLEFTSNPAWYAVQSLPYLMEYPHECTEQLLNRYYANSLASSVANKYPIVKATFAQWKDADKEAFLSNLSKNQELKTALLKETPWVYQAQREEVQKRHIGLLFDLNRMNNEFHDILEKIQYRQSSDGGFPWFHGDYSDWYVTQYLIETMGHLDKLGVSEVTKNPIAWSVVEKAIRYCDNQVFAYYKDIEFQVANKTTTRQENHLTPLIIHYLYARTFFLNNLSKTANNSSSTIQINKNFINFNSERKPAFEYFLNQAETYYLKQNVYQQGMIALALDRMGRPNIPNKIVKSLKERALYNEELGMYFKTETGYNWYQLPIECHALLMEVFQEVGQDNESIEKMKIWLLKHKQTNNWKTTKATSAAVYALLTSGDNWLLESEAVELNFVNANEKHNYQISEAQCNAEAGTGYFKTRIQSTEVNNSLTKVSVNNPNKGIAWGAAYWQYFEEMDKITSFEDTPLKIKKQLFKVILTDTGEKLIPIKEGTKLSPGDKIKVRIELRVDRSMEYVHMKDGRSSGFEPMNVLSRYKWQGGLGYYESTHDASTDFFFSRLPKGTHVFEYPIRVVHNGNFSNGITTVQCMYAPEFTSHSEGVRVEVE